MTYPIPYDALDDRLGFIGTSGSGKTYNAGSAVERLLSKKARVVIIDPLGVWWGLRLSGDGKHASGFDVAIFGGPRGDLPLNEHAGALIGETAATMQESCIIDLRELGSKASERRFMTAFLETLYRKASGEPFHLVVDEADLFAPQKPMGGDETLLGHMENIVRRGRVKGFVPWLISQRPAVVNKNVLSQVDGLIAFKLTSTQDRDALDAWIEGQADRAEGKAIKDALPAMQVGQGVVWLPGHGVLKIVQFPQKVTFDSSRAPKRGQREAKVKALQPLNLESLKNRLVTVTAEAKANDPKALRTEIAALRAEKAKLEKQVAIAKPIADNDALAVAEKRGFERAKKALLKFSTESAMDIITAALDDVRQRINPLLEVIETRAKEARQTKLHFANSVEYSPSSAPVAQRTAPPVQQKPQPAQRIVPARNGAFNRPQMRVLRSLAMWKAVGHDSPSREMVAAGAGYAPGSGNFNNLVGGLSTSGAITIPQSGRLSLALDDIDVPLNGFRIAA